MNYQKQIEEYFQGKEEELVRAVSRLAAIRSVKEEAGPGMPFGEGCAKALAEALKLAGELGLRTENHEGYVGTADLNGQETVLHILGHLDVVGEGTGWTVTGPFDPKVAGGMIYGRGVADDKGPVAAVLMAMGAVKELGVPLKKNVRAILGADEESGSEDIAYYYAKEPYAPYTFSPDADFPVINIEKGGYKPTFTKQWEASGELPRLVSFDGGFRLNVIPGQAEAVIEGMPMNQLLARVKMAGAITGAEFHVMPRGNGRILIRAIGKGGHAMDPEGCCNPITALLELLGVLPFAESGSKNALHALLELLPQKDTCGKALGIAQSDELSGELTVAFTLLKITESGLEGRFDARTPLCATEDTCKERCEKAFEEKGFSCTGDMTPPHHTPADSPFVQTLLKCYEQYTGQKGECLAIGGTTYVHDIPGGVAFGPVMPGFDTNLHGSDERIAIEHLLTAAKIFTQVIIDLCA